MLTFYDLTMHALAYLGKDATASPDAKRAVLAAYRELGSMREWSYYTRMYRLNTNAPQTTGTIAYDHTGGAYERLLTISGATWPTWAEFAYVVIANTRYEVARRIDDTRLQLSEQSNPGADVAALTTYSIERDTYPLPTDFVAIKTLSWGDNNLMPSFVEPGQWAQRLNYNNNPARPLWYTIFADQNYFGNMALKFWNAPDDDYSIDLLYLCRGRNLVIERHDEGTISTTLDSATITGSGTNWTSRMRGSVIRTSNIAAGVSKVPTGNDGQNPYIDERVIIEVASATSLTVDLVATQTLASKRYLVSDPVDIEAGAMQTLLQRAIEKQCRSIYRMKALNEEGEAYREAMMRAFEADSRYAGPRRAGLSGYAGQRLEDMPIDFGV